MKTTRKGNLLKATMTIIIALVMATSVVAAVPSTLKWDVAIEAKGKTLTLKEANGETPVMGVIVSGRTFVPLRAVAEAFDQPVDYNEGARAAYVGKKPEVFGAPREDGVVRLYINGSEVIPEVPPFVVDGRIYVPLRVISETLKYPVSWNERARKVTISDLASSKKPTLKFVGKVRTSCATELLEPKDGSQKVIKEIESLVWVYILKEVEGYYYVAEDMSGEAVYRIDVVDCYEPKPLE